MKNYLQILCVSLLMCFCTPHQELFEDVDQKISTESEDGFSVTELADGSSLDDIDLVASYAQFNLLGHGWDASKNFAVQDGTSNKNQVIDILALNNHPANLITLFPMASQYGRVEYQENAREYLNKISTDVKINTSFPVFGLKLSSEFTNSLSSENKFHSKYIYSSASIYYIRNHFKIVGDFTDINSYELQLIRNNYLNNNFILHLNIHTPQTIVQTYGTHVLRDLLVGAKFSMTYQGETKEIDRKYQSSIGIKVGAEKLTSFNFATSGSSSDLQKNSNNTIKYHAYGGNPSTDLFGTLNFTLNTTNSQLNLTPWVSSQTDANSKIVDVPEYGYVPIYYFISDITKRNQVMNYVNQYLSTNGVQLINENVAIHRYYNHNAFNHFYTADPSSELLNGYVSDGIAFLAHTYRAPGSVPIYRFYSHTGKNHYYVKGDGTTAPGPFSGYVAEGVRFYAYATQVSGSKAVYELYKHQSSSKFNHLYTTSLQERNSLLSNGWEGGGIVFYAL